MKWSFVRALFFFVAVLVVGCDSQVERAQEDGVDELLVYYRGIREMSPARYSRDDLIRVARTKLHLRDAASIEKVTGAIPADCEVDPMMAPDDLDYYLVIIGERNGRRLFEFGASKFNYVTSASAGMVCKLENSELVDLTQSIETSQKPK
jgi:hypothetical protein